MTYVRHSDCCVALEASFMSRKAWWRCLVGSNPPPHLKKNLCELTSYQKTHSCLHRKAQETSDHLSYKFWQSNGYTKDTHKILITVIPYLIHFHPMTKLLLAMKICESSTINPCLWGQHLNPSFPAVIWFYGKQGEGPKSFTDSPGKSQIAPKGGFKFWSVDFKTWSGGCRLWSMRPPL